MHGLEREAVFSAHAADGHHGTETGTHARESCATGALPDVACALCQGTSASVLAPSASAVPDASLAAVEARIVERAEARTPEAPAGRGPPEAAA